MSPQPRTPQARQRGFFYAEALLSAVLLAVLLVPALDALRSGISGGAIPADAGRPLLLRDKMEDVLSRPFADLYAQTYLPGGNTTSSVSSTYSDAVGAANRRLVVLYRYNATTKALSSSDTGLLRVSVYFAADTGATPLYALAGRWW
ncbi:MAG: hypothetical protein Q8Q16_09205 [Betaproteobacteria bacterium]|nr:hypothetical protein [Betaproteobacteria bacterium]